MARWSSLFKGQFTGSSYSAAVAASASSAAATPFAYRAFLGVDGTRVASCDAGSTSPIFTEDYLTGLRTASETIFRHDTLNYLTKEYFIELKPLFSAFQMKPLALTAIRSFLLNYSPLLERRHQDVELVQLFRNSVKQIIRETTVVTTRRVLERFVVHYCSQRTAWKLLKDLPESALRKSSRGMPFYTCTFCVARTTFRGHFLGVASACLVQVCIEVGIECYRCVRDIVRLNREEDVDVVPPGERARAFGGRVCRVMVNCAASLVLASIGAGIGATLFRPTSGQSIGCFLGELAGPVIVTFCFAPVP